MDRKKISILAMCAAIMCAVPTGCQDSRMSLEIQSETAEPGTQTPGGDEREAVESHETNAEPKTVFVDISGAVKKPGVYELLKDARVCDAVRAAGGLTKDADQDVLNQAQRLEDGEKVYVRTEQEAEELSLKPDSPSEAGDGAQKDAMVNINTAEASALMTLPGIGESKAADIIAYRTEHGGFQTIDEIKNISGIKDAVFNKIKDKIAV